MDAGLAPDGREDLADPVDPPRVGRALEDRAQVEVPEAARRVGEHPRPVGPQRHHVVTEDREQLVVHTNARGLSGRGNPIERNTHRCVYLQLDADAVVD